VGESEKAVREIFRKARQTAPTILFFDEIDAVVPRRNSNGDNNVTERVVNQMLSEIDGLESLNDVVVIAATNRPDIVDPALLRQGRFDRILLVPVSDEAGRKRVFEIYTKKMPIAEDVDLTKLAHNTKGYVGADIEGVCREAAMIALRADSTAKKITMANFKEALTVVRQSVDKETEQIYTQLSEYFSAARAKEITEAKARYFG
ncbi:AAA family ATPase, partial [Candidatus Woesearchaeota archaeon]|nr:AAA family ATPase [Candidatus Woesearchaeota archaeon]